MKHPYKAIENHWKEIFIIRAGMRQGKFGEFSTLANAQGKCDELNGAAK